MTRALSISRGIGCGLALAALTFSQACEARGYRQLYAFQGSDGSGPEYPIVMYKGDFYSTTNYGGADGNGTIFKLASDGTESVLYSFTGGADGAQPTGIIIDHGSILGTAIVGGGGHCRGDLGSGCGTVFSLAADGTLTQLHAFKGGARDGALPNAGLLPYDGKYYGTTGAGGSGTCNFLGVAGCGTIFSIGADGREKILYSVQGGAADGAVPNGPLIADDSGNLYGITTSGGNGGCTFYTASGCGTVFRISSDGSNYSVLYSFCSQTDCADGAEPYTVGLARDASGNLYGTTMVGGTGCVGKGGCGTVFRIAPDGTETVLYSFCSQADCTDGSEPYAGVISDTEGNLYGTTAYGGARKKGTVFRLATDGTEQVLYSFTGRKDGAAPEAALTAGRSGTLYGTTYYGSACNCGTVFRIKE